MRQPARHFVFDFDSTLVQVESLPELARIFLRHHPERVERLRELERITELTASGKMSMAEGLTLRLELASAHRKHVDSLVRVLRRSLTPSVKRNRLFFRDYQHHIYVVSNGFQEFIGPVTETLGLKSDHLFANSLLIDDRGYIVGFDPKNPLTHQDGKARVLKGLQLAGECLVVGDGFSDAQIKEAGLATRFYAFTENVRRELVVEQADHVLPSVDELSLPPRPPTAWLLPSFPDASSARKSTRPHRNTWRKRVTQCGPLRPVPVKTRSNESWKASRSSVFVLAHGSRGRF